MKQRILYLLLSAFFSVFLGSCKKSIKRNYILTIYVVDEEDNIVENAVIKLFAESDSMQSPEIYREFAPPLATDFEGKIYLYNSREFNMTRAGYLLLNIEGTLPSYITGADSLIGSGLIKIEPDIENEYKLIVLPA
ncbi:MAG: hypothetical protein AB8B74_11340 [Crocinitomicaceae bacterium]